MATAEHATEHAHLAGDPAGHANGAADHAEAAPPTLRVLVYSDDPKTREQVVLAVGRRPVADLPGLEFAEFDSSDAVVEAVGAGEVDLAILDGEAVPAGGMGLARQLKNEVASCPPILLLTGRRDDYWLAMWSQADGAVPHPLDAIAVADAVVALLRSAVAHAPAVRSR